MVEELTQRKSGEFTEHHRGFSLWISVSPLWNFV